MEYDMALVPHTYLNQVITGSIPGLLPSLLTRKEPLGCALLGESNLLPLKGTWLFGHANPVKSPRLRHHICPAAVTTPKEYMHPFGLGVYAPLAYPDVSSCDTYAYS